MKVLHTSDWHLGRSLYGRKRYEEFDRFLDWLAEHIKREEYDVLLIAGDIFDNGTPSNRAQEQYYSFLCRIADSSCRCQHVVIVAGNHDSPSMINAPKRILQCLNIHVVGSCCQDPKEEVFLLQNGPDGAGLIVCAVPYLRDRDIRKAEAGEDSEEKNRKLLAGIQAHYAAVCAHAEQVRKGQKEPVPVVAMGHLFTSGGQTIDGDGVRELYIGSLGHVGSDTFPDSIDYLALGHLHVPQLVDGNPNRRYSGSPLAMSFGEASQQKTVIAISFDGESAVAEEIAIPCFQALEMVKGDWDEISERITVLKQEEAAAWLEITYDGKTLIGDLQARLQELIADSDLEILRIKNNPLVEQTLKRMHTDETLEDMDEYQVFERCLQQHQIPEEQRPELVDLYKQVVRELREEDVKAE